MNIRLQKPKLGVKPGEITKEQPWEKTRQERQEYKLREKMIKKKHRKLYKSMMQGKRDRGKEAWLLKKKRQIYDEKVKDDKKLRKHKKNVGVLRKN